MIEKELTIKLTPGNTKQKGPRDYSKLKDGDVAYVFSDPNLGEFDVKKSANAWWLDGGKLYRLVSAYKFYATDDQACFHAGITKAQLVYFQKIHADFYNIKHAAKQQPILTAKKTIMETLHLYPERATWILERLEKETFSTRQENTGAGGKDLFDGMTQEMKEMTEEVRNLIKKDGDKDKTEKHTSKPAAGDNDAGQNGAGHDATSTDTSPGPEDVSA